MHKGVIVVQAPNKTIDEAYLKIAAGERDTYVGFLIPTSDGLMHAKVRGEDYDELIQIVKDTNEQLKTDEKTKDKPMVLLLGATDATQDDDLQPHIILKEGNKPILAAFIEGELEEEFTGLAEQSPQHHTPEFFAIQTYLIGKIAGIHQKTNDLSETIKEIKFSDKEIKARLRNDKTSRLALTFVASNGDIFSITQNDKEKVFSWGYTSQAFGYDEGTEISKPVLSSKSVFGTTTTPTPISSPEPGPKENPLPDGSKPSVPSVPQKDNDITKPEDMLFIPPANISSRGARKDWYKNYGKSGILNEISKNEFRSQYGDWNEGKAPVRLNHVMLKKVDDLLRDSKIVRWSEGGRPIAGTKPITKDTAPAAITDKSSEDKFPNIGMILQPQARQKLEVLLPRVVAIRDEKGQLIFDPNKLGEYEKNFPTIPEQLGKSDISLIPMSPEQFDIMLSIGPEDALIIAKRMFFQAQGMAWQFKTLYEKELDKSSQSKSKSAFG